MGEIREAIRIEVESSKKSSYKTFFETRGNIRRFFTILAVGFFSQWSGGGVISYYLTLVLDSIGYTSQSQQTLINGILQAWGLVWGIFFALICERFGRRTLFMISTAGSFAAYVGK